MLSPHYRLLFPVRNRFPVLSRISVGRRDLPRLTGERIFPSLHSGSRSRGIHHGLSPPPSSGFHPSQSFSSSSSSSSSSFSLFSLSALDSGAEKKSKRSRSKKRKKKPSPTAAAAVAVEAEEAEEELVTAETEEVEQESSLEEEEDDMDPSVTEKSVSPRKIPRVKTRRGRRARTQPWEDPGTNIYGRSKRAPPAAGRGHRGGKATATWPPFQMPEDDVDGEEEAEEEDENDLDAAEVEDTKLGADFRALQRQRNRSWNEWLRSVPPPPEDVVEKREQLMAYVHQLANSLDSTKFRILMRRLQRFKSVRQVSESAKRKFVADVVERVFDGHRDSIVSLRLVQHMMEMDLEELFSQRCISLVALPYVAAFVLQDSHVGAPHSSVGSSDLGMYSPLHPLYSGGEGSGGGGGGSSGGVDPVTGIPETKTTFAVARTPEPEEDSLVGFSGVLECSNGRRIAYETDPRAEVLQKYLFDLVGGAQFKVFVNNLHPEITVQEMIEQFSPCGDVLGVEIFRERLRGPQHIQDIRSFVEPSFGQHAILSTHNEDLTSAVYGFVYFKDETGVRNSLHMAAQLFGIHIKGRPCRTEPPADKRTLYLGNLPHHISTEPEAVDWVESQLADKIPRGSVVSVTSNATLRNGWCFVEFDSHASAWIAHRTLMQMEVGDRNGETSRVLRAGWNTHRLPGKYDVRTQSWLDQLSHMSLLGSSSTSLGGGATADGLGAAEEEEEEHTPGSQHPRFPKKPQPDPRTAASASAVNRAVQHEYPLLQYLRLERTEAFNRHHGLIPDEQEAARTAPEKERKKEN